MKVEAFWPRQSGAEILLVSPAEADYTCLSHILDQSRWKLYWALNCKEALAFLRQHPVGVVITTAHLPDGNWESLLEAVAGLPAAPSLIVSSRLADERLWAEVLNLGGYDVLLTPFEPSEVVRVGSAAWWAWEQRVQAEMAVTDAGYSRLRTELPAA